MPWEVIVAADFFTVEVWTARGLKRFLVLFFIDLSTRKVEIGGIASSANGLWMSQIGRRATGAVDGILIGKRYLIHDRDPLFTAEFQRHPLSCPSVHERYRPSRPIPLVVGPKFLKLNVVSPP